MEKKENNETKIIKEGKKISEASKKENKKEAKKRTIMQYLIPLIMIIVLGIIYIVTQQNVLLIIFGILMFVVLWGWDCSSRTCPNCKKWNSVIWEKTERRVRKTTIIKKSILGKKYKKEVKHKYLKFGGKCKNCECEFETEKNRML